MLQISATWTNDCQGKKDFDGDILRVSTRYWPADGGFFTLCDGVLDEHPIKDGKPSAKSSIILLYGDPGEQNYIDLVSADFEGETFEDVASQVEAWAQEQMNNIVGILSKEFPDILKKQP